MRRIGAILLSCLFAAASPAIADDSRCAVPRNVSSLDAELGTFREKVQSGSPVVIVALGSSSTAGAGVSSPSLSYPSILEAELRRLWPQTEFRVVNAGIGGQRALDMYRRMDAEIVAHQPALVIWQTGVNDAVHHVGLERFRRTIEKGIAKLHEAGADVVIMDHQLLPREERLPQYGAYRDALRATARDHEAGLFRRYDVMRSWTASGAFAPGEIVGSDGLHMVEMSYRCLAVVLAGALYDAVEGVPERRVGDALR